MEHARHGEGNDDPVQPWPAMGDPAEELPDPDELDTQAMPGYLTLEMDVSDLRALATDADPPSSHTDDRIPEYQEPVLEASDLEMLEALEPFEALEPLEALEPEELSLPGYLTLEVDFEALDNESPGQG